MRQVSRREAVAIIASVLGGAAAAPGLAEAIAAAAGSRGGVLPAERLSLLDTLCETILPATDTPGAAQAGVAQFIDSLLAAWYSPAERDEFLSGLADVEQRCLLEERAAFPALPAARRLSFLQRLDAEAASAAADGRKPFFRTLKELTLIGFYTSETCMQNELRVIGPVGDAADTGLPDGGSWL